MNFPGSLRAVAATFLVWLILSSAVFYLTTRLDYPYEPWRQEGGPAIGVTPRLNENRGLGQVLEAANRPISYLAIQFATYARQPSGRIEIRLLAGEEAPENHAQAMRRTIKVWSLDASQFKDNRFFKLSINPVEMDGTKPHYLLVTMPSDEQLSPLSIWLTKQDRGRGKISQIIFSGKSGQYHIKDQAGPLNIEIGFNKYLTVNQAWMIGLIPIKKAVWLGLFILLPALWISIGPPRLVFLSCLPVAALLINPHITFGNAVGCDPLVYWSLMQTLDHYSFWQGVMTIDNLPHILTRVSAIIPGYCLYKTFPPIFAHYAWHLGHLYIIIFSFYYVVRRFNGIWTGLAAAVVMALDRCLLGTASTAYVATPVLAFAMLTAALITAARFREDSKAKWLMIAAGAALSGVVIAQSKSIIYFFPLPLLYVRRVEMGAWRFYRHLLTVCGWMTIGGLAGMAVWGAANSFLFGGDLVLLASKLRSLPRVWRVEAGLDPQMLSTWRSWPDWISKGPTVHLGVFGLLLGLGRLWLDRNDADKLKKELVFILPLVLVALAIIIYKANDRIILTYSKFGLVLPVIYLSFIPTLFSLNTNGLEKTFKGKMLLLGLAVVPLACLPLTERYFFVGSLFENIGPIAIFLPLVFGLAVLVLLQISKRRQTALVAALGLFLLFTLGLKPDSYGSYPWREFPNKLDLAAYTRLWQGMEFLHELNFKVRPRFWIGNGPAERITYPTAFKNCALRKAKFPVELPEEFIEPGQPIVVIERNYNLPITIAKAEEWFAARSVKSRIIGKKTISSGGVSYNMVVFVIEKGQA